MTNSKFSKLLTPDSRIYLWIVALLVLIIFYYNIIIGAIGILILVYLQFYNWRSSKQRSKKWQMYIENLSSDIDSAAKYAILNLPLPLTLIDFDGRVSWYNSKFNDVIDAKDILGENIEALIPYLDTEKIIDGEDQKGIKVGDRYYDVLNNIVKIQENKESRYIIMLYWLDITDYNTLRDSCEEEKPVIALIQVDNYDDVMNETKEDKRPFLKSEIDSKITLWASRMNGLIKKYEDDKYLVIFESRYIQNLEAKKFSILDDIREIDAGNKIPVTLSIGVGLNGKNFSKIEEYAYSSLELSLGRGGDQAVVRKDGNFEFYGGKTKAVEKRNRVKARIIAHAFKPLIDDSNKVLIMGHKFPDMDCYGSAIGVYRAVLNRGKEPYIVLNTVTEPIKNIHALFKDNDEYNFISSEEAIEIAEDDDKVMLVVVDTHRPSSTECPELLEICERVVLMDHHRMGTDFIENPVLRYLEPYASSTSELVTEILQYMGSKMHLEKVEAEALLAGILVDTKNFTFKTGVRTFEAASLLRRFGADTTVVKQLFQDDLSTFIAKSNVVRNAKIYSNEVAISVCETDILNAQLVAAQGADDLLNIRGITTSFVLIREDDTIYISGRSLGETNVQVILEKIGGGGHLSIAGAQFKNIPMEEAKEKLLKVIDEYFEEGEKK
ncbi:MAG: DHH family phosphoesterase [Acidaminobacteraceae bacterium]